MDDFDHEMRAWMRVAEAVGGSSDRCSASRASIRAHRLAGGPAAMALVITSPQHASKAKLDTAICDVDTNRVLMTALHDTIGVPTIPVGSYV